jgi:hypothetical protein
VHVQQGSSIALSADGTTALTGGMRDNNEIGAVWPFFDKQLPVITFNQLPNVTYGAADINPGATSTDNTAPIIYKSGDTSVAVIVNNKIHIKAAGLASITATQTG